MSKTPEQEARNILERMEIKGAQNFSAGELAEIANIIAESGESLGGELEERERRMEVEALLAERDAEIARLRLRLEVTYAYNLSGKRIEVPAGSIPDGISCRDETIKMQDAEISRLRDDAERYQFLRDDFSVSSPNIDGNHSWAYRRNFSLKGPTLDAAIDAARKETK